MKPGSRFGGKRSNPRGGPKGKGGRGGRGGGRSNGRGRGSGGGRDRDDRDRGGRFGGDRGRPFRKKVCRFCGGKRSVVNYKDVESIHKFVTEKGKIIPRRITGTCAKHQRDVAASIKRCRHSGLLAFQTD
jgi:small subunit ribosomal protein S18